MEKKDWKKREKNIVIRQGKKGLSFQVWIPYKDSNGNQTGYSDTINEKDFDSIDEAWEAALLSKAQGMQMIQIAGFHKKSLRVEVMYEMYHECFPISKKSEDRHQFYYKHGIVETGMADRKINKITAAELQRSIAQFAQKHPQGAVKRLVSLWRGIYKTAMMNGIMVVNQAELITVPKSSIETKKRNTDMTYQDFLDFMQHLQEHQFKGKGAEHRKKVIPLIFWILLYTGIRPQEVLALGPDDIDFEKNVIHIRHSVGSTQTEYRQIIHTKTPKSIRDIPIVEPLKPYLEEALEYSNTNPILCDYDGKPFEICTIDDLVKRIGKKYGSTVTPYQLRHYFAANLFTDGVNPKAIQELMGHSEESMSLYYAFSTKEEQREALEKRRMS